MSGLVWGIKRIDPDLTTGRTRDGAAVIHWPVQTGGWVEHPTPEKVLHGDTCGVGIHVAKTWRGASLGGSLTEAAGIVVGWHPNDVVAESADKARVRRCLVVPGVTPFPAVVRNGWCARADLAWADLARANLTRADLTGATGGEWTRLPAGWKVDGGLIVRDGQ